jgi:hypothetical protein
MPYGDLVLYSLLHSHLGRIQCHNSDIEPNVLIVSEVYEFYGHTSSNQDFQPFHHYS